MDAVWQAVRAAAEQYGGQAVAVLVLLVVGWLAMRYLIAPLRRLLERGRVDPSATSFLTNSARALILTVVLLAVLQQVGVQMTSLLAVLGAAGLAVALSLQNAMSNFAAGLQLLAFRIARVGDLVEVGDFRGRVTEMLPFHVVLLAADNQRITVPNSLLAGGPVRNHSALPTRRAAWVLPVAGGKELDAAKAALLAKLREDRRILAEPAPQVYVKDWAEDKRAVAVEAWTSGADYLAVQQDLLERLGEAVQRSRAPSASEGGHSR